mmetsp:Transcript_28274/g.93850  ORF Transcript_28274/g.93850 Transcript_28274/m.93850 type:complete len:302 (+) Transcript_28274:2053-2958(+)
MLAYWEVSAAIRFTFSSLTCMKPECFKICERSSLWISWESGSLKRMNVAFILAFSPSEKSAFSEPWIRASTASTSGSEVRSFLIDERRCRICCRESPGIVELLSSLSSSMLSSAASELLAPDPDLPLSFTAATPPPPSSEPAGAKDTPSGRDAAAHLPSGPTRCRTAASTSGVPVAPWHFGDDAKVAKVRACHTEFGVVGRHWSACGGVTGFNPQARGREGDDVPVWPALVAADKRGLPTTYGGVATGDLGMAASVRESHSSSVFEEEAESSPNSMLLEAQRSPDCSMSPKRGFSMLPEAQ